MASIGDVCTDRRCLFRNFDVDCFLIDRKLSYKLDGLTGLNKLTLEIQVVEINMKHLHTWNNLLFYSVYRADRVQR